MKVRVSFNITLADRRAIANQVGKPRAATHGDVLLWIEKTVRAVLEDIVADGLAK
jgi:hypothetical protein